MEINRIILRTKFILFFLLSFALLLTLSGIANAQLNDYYYRDKLFGKLFTFTPKPDELMVKFSPQTKGLQKRTAENVAKRLNLKTVQDAVETYQFGIYKIPVGSTMEAITSQLKAASGIQAIHPVLIDQEGYTRYFIPGEFTVQFNKDVSVDDIQKIVKSYSCQIIEKHYTPGFYTLSVPADKEPLEMIRIFTDLSEVRSSGFNSIGFNLLQFDPNDTYYPQQWALHNTGTNGGTADVDIDAREAWDIERGHPDVVIPVLDTGVQWDHEDLGPNIWQNLGEDADGDGRTIEYSNGNWILDPGDINNFDDDGNDHDDDLIGWDFVDDNKDPHPGTQGIDKILSHGTNCAGIIAAVADNKGVVGLAHNCRIMPVRVFNGNGATRMTDIVDGINYALHFINLTEGIVFNNCWSWDGDEPDIHAAIQSVKNAGGTLCFASGNSNMNTISYPAKYPEVIAVGATNQEDMRCTPADWGDALGSHYGPELDISAPGVNIYTTDLTGADGPSPTDYHSSFQGTSASTPFVAAAAALLFSHHYRITIPGEYLLPDMIQDILQETADKVGGYDYSNDEHCPELGYGRLNVNRALQELITRTVPVLEVEHDPVDIALSIDRSGSMTQPKLNAAKNAARQVVRLMNFGDRIAVTSYDHETFVDFNISEITSEDVKTDAINAIDAIEARGMTSIGGGLLTAQNQLSQVSNPTDPQAIILMSDGMSNTSPWIKEVLPSIHLRTNAYTIGFATAAENISEDSLQLIASSTGGTYFFAGADELPAGTSASKLLAQSSGGMELIQSYQISLNDASRRETIKFSSGIADTSQTVTIEVDPSIAEMRFSLLWEDASASVLYTLTDPNGLLIDPIVATGNPYIDYIEDLTVASYAVRSPEPGLWTLNFQGLGFRKYSVSASAYSGLKSILSFQNLGIAQPLIVELKLIENGLPVTGAYVNATIHLPDGFQVGDFRLFDDGNHQDGVENDGLYANYIDSLLNEGSYTIETIATGDSVTTGKAFTRYDVSSTYIHDVQTIQASLPNSLALYGQIIEIPINIHTNVFGRNITSYSAGFTFNPQILSATGTFEVEGTMSENWTVDLNQPAADQIEINATGPNLDGKGALANVMFEVGGDLGDTCSLKFTHFNMNGGVVPVSTTNGSFTVGSSIITMFNQTITVGWHMIGLPLQVFDPHYQKIYPNALPGTMYRFDGTYYQEDSLKPGSGYWLRFIEEDTLICIGESFNSVQLDLDAGWHMISGVSGDLALVDVIDSAGIIIPNTLFGFDRGYVRSDSIKQGCGYWLRTSAPGQIVLDLYTSGASESAVDAITAQHQTDYLMETDHYPSLEISNANGVSQKLRYMVTMENPEEKLCYSMPPLPPEQLFDARFRGDFRITENESGIIQVQSSQYPITVHAKGGAFHISEILPDGEGKQYDLTDLQSIRIDNPMVKEIEATLTAHDMNNLPKTFTLRQNYPNPFNPSTTISFTLPRSEFVELKIYNLVGEQLMTLVSKELNPGNHTYTFDGKNIASGVYYYQIKAGEFQDVKKMILLK